MDGEKKQPFLSLTAAKHMALAVSCSFHGVFVSLCVPPSFFSLLAVGGGNLITKLEWGQEHCDNRGRYPDYKLVVPDRLSVLQTISLELDSSPPFAFAFMSCAVSSLLCQD